MTEYKIRVAKTEDAEEIHDIYGAYIDSEDVTFTINNPDVEAYRKKINTLKEKYPFYVAEDQKGNIIGYVYGSPLRPHDAYQWNVESTIMLAPHAPRRQGIASSLYHRFFKTLKQQGFQYVYGVLVDTNEASIELHKALGFIEAGHFHNAGFKSGKWKGIVWMQKQIGDLQPDTIIPFSQIEAK